MFKWFSKKNKVSFEDEIYNKIQEGLVEYSSIIDFLEFVDPGDEGRIYPIKCKNGKTGRFKIISFTPCSDWGSKNVKVLFEGYLNDKPVKELTLEEFINNEYVDMFKNAKFKKV